jgi:hypothetical protein
MNGGTAGVRSNWQSEPDASQCPLLQPELWCTASSCFENAERHLADDGCFVVETAVPNAWIAPGQPDYVHAERVGMSEVAFDVARYDAVTQLLVENHVRLTESGITFAPIVCRLITPGEMDLMARLAGLRLADRFATWRCEPFTVHSRGHVSVYEKA